MDLSIFQSQKTIDSIEKPIIEFPTLDKIGYFHAKKEGNKAFDSVPLL